MYKMGVWKSVIFQIKMASVPGLAAEAVLVKSEDMPAGSETVKVSYT